MLFIIKKHGMNKFYRIFDARISERCSSDEML